MAESLPPNPGHPSKAGTPIEVRNLPDAALEAARIMGVPDFVPKIMGVPDFGGFRPNVAGVPNCLADRSVINYTC